MRNAYSILFTLLITLFFVGCAEEQKEDLGKKQTASFEAWMKLYAPAAQQIEEGVYVEKLISVTSTDAKSPVSGDWVEVNYTGRGQVTGDVYVTRDSMVAHVQGTFQSYTHYVPRYLAYKSSEVTLTMGQKVALGLMKEGETWRVYVSAAMGYDGFSPSVQSGYEGQKSLGANKPIIVDMELVKIVADPVVYENRVVQAYALDTWGIQAEDSIAGNTYYQRKKMGLEDPILIAKDSSVKVYYVGCFLDGFVFDTNIADTAKKHNIYNATETSKYNPYEVNMAESKNVAGFNAALLKMTYGESGTVIFTSYSGYGAVGKSSTGSTVIQPYTPLMFYLQVLPYAGDGTEEYPYTVSAVLAMKEPKAEAWVEGYIVGVVEGTNPATQSKFIKPFTNKTNLLIAKSSISSNYKECVVVELPEGSTVQTKLNLVDNLVRQRFVKVLGNIQPVMGQQGVAATSKYKL